MSTLAMILIGLVAALHLWFLLLEMLLWTRPLGLKTFRMTPEKAETTKVLAANQGLYNGFLVAGLVYALVTGSREFAVFFLVCVIVAGVYGGLTARMSILYVQAAPALAAMLAVLAVRPARQREHLL